MKEIKGLTYEQLREVYALCLSRGNDFKQMVSSIFEEELSYEEFIDWDYFLYNGKYYGANDWCLDIQGDLQQKDDCVWIDEDSEWMLQCDAYYAWTSRRDRQYFSNDEYLYHFNDEYYTSDALEDHDLVIMDGGDVEHRDDVYYWESDGDYHYEPEEETSYTREYHSGGYRSLEFKDKNTKYRIGFEIEKEDQVVKESVYIGGFEDLTGDLWRKERDGSLDDDSGYELISPAFDFSVEDIFNHINSNPTLVSHINAEYSTSCGGHINLSKKGHSGREMFDEVKGYTPLLYALYYGRIDKNYSKGKSNKDLLDENEKYQAIKIHDNRIEFRIISAVPSVDVLRWRCELIETMLKHPCSDVRDAYYYFDTKFSKIIKRVYNTDDKYKALKNRLRKYTLEFEKITLKTKEDSPTKRRKALAEAAKKYVEFKVGAKVKVVKTTATNEEWNDRGEVPLHKEIGDIVEIEQIVTTFIRFKNPAGITSYWYPREMFEFHEKSDLKYNLGGAIKAGDKVVCIKTLSDDEEWFGIGRVDFKFNVGDVLEAGYISDDGRVIRIVGDINSWAYPASMFAPLLVNSQS